MPSVPSSNKCSHLGCKNPRSKFNSYCMEHGGAEKRAYNPKHNQSQERKENGLMYKTRQWLALRQIQLSKQPLCVGCLANEVVTPANTVDHLFPWTRISKEAFFINKFQSLCPTHHAEKTQLERHGIYRRFGKPNIDYSSTDYAYVVGLENSQERE